MGEGVRTDGGQRETNTHIMYSVHTHTHTHTRYTNEKRWGGVLCVVQPQPLGRTLHNFETPPQKKTTICLLTHLCSRCVTTALCQRSIALTVVPRAEWDNLPIVVRLTVHHEHLSSQIMCWKDCRTTNKRRPEEPALLPANGLMKRMHIFQKDVCFGKRCQYVHFTAPIFFQVNLFFFCR